ncbi:MAG: CBS domain-containing protein [Acidobacteriota bacterium]|nr:CBS domain-containing protein [Acidobacteriota bacterium]
MRVRTAMLEQPVTTHPDQTFDELLQNLVGSRQATAAVLDDDGKLVGLVGIHDVLRKIVPLYVDLDHKLMEVMHEGYFEERLARLKDTRVRDFMSTELDTVTPDDTLIKAVVIIVENRRKTLPVIEDGKFLGMITRRSILEKVVPSLP